MSTKKIIIAVGVVCVVGVVIFFLFRKESSEINTEKILQAISEHMELPLENPLSTLRIENPEELALKQPFFIDAIAGDVLVVYEARAIIWSPSRKKIVNVGPINYSEPAKK